MMDLRPSCELCGEGLPPDTDRARICTYECTFCVDCATWKLWGICPNCTGELVIRPRRPASRLVTSPASTTEVRKEHDLVAHEAMVRRRLVDGDLPDQTWIVSFANERHPADVGYAETATEMDDLARRQPGFLSVDAVRGDDGIGITVSRWSSVAAMISWRRLTPHTEAQRQGRSGWYRSYRSDVARVDRVSEFSSSGSGSSKLASSMSGASESEDAGFDRAPPTRPAE